MYSVKIQICIDWVPWGEGRASLGSSARPRRHARGQAASYQTAPPPRKIRLISWGSMSLVSDTTLDLSQKAEKGMLVQTAPGVYILCERHSFGNQYGIKTQVLACLLACPLFALRLFCVFHFVPRFSRIFVWYIWSLCTR